MADPSGADSQTIYDFDGNGYSVGDNDLMTVWKAGDINASPLEDVLGRYGFFGGREGNYDGSVGDPKGVHGVGTALFKAGMIKSPTFFGVPIRLIPGEGDVASYFGEAINMSVGKWKEYLETGLDSGVGRLLMHEYGHYLQSQIGDNFWYYLGAAPSSLISFLSSNSAAEHAQNWAEIQASTLAYYYFGKPDKFIDPRRAANIVKDNYSSMQILNALYNQYLNHPNY
ncbi:MAG: hypothetical protein PHC34_13245 [Candidatus Gastranaerophilales bacterium]|nr:hypothetical protein [Candidatus Gastranaerophilales bacterium]